MEQQEQQVGNVRTNEVTNLGTSHLDPDVIRYILDSSPELIILENELLGRKYNYGIGAWESDIYATKRLNEKGVRHLMSDMRVRVSKITTQGKLDDDTINKIIKRYGFLVSLWLFQYKHEWEIQKDIDRTMIMRLLVDTYLVTLNKSSGGWSGNSLSKMYTKSDTFQQVPQQKRGLRKFLPF